MSPSLQGIIQVVDDLLETPEDLETLPNSEQNFVATNLLLNMEHSLRELSKVVPNESLTFSTSGGTGKYHCRPQAVLWLFSTSFLPQPH